MCKATTATVFVLTTLFTQDATAQRVVVNADNPKEEITIEELKNIYHGNQSFWGSPTEPVFIKPVLNRGSAKDDFFELLDTTEARFQRHWIRLTLAGKANPPKALKREGDILTYIAHNEGGIGYVGTSELPAGVKEIPIRR